MNVLCTKKAESFNIRKNSVRQETKKSKKIWLRFTWFLEKMSLSQKRCLTWCKEKGAIYQEWQIL